MDTTETSETLLAQAQEIRDQAVQLHAEEQAVLAAAQAEADRLRAEADRVLAEGRNQAAKLSSRAADIDRSAEPVQLRAHHMEMAEQLAEAVPAAEDKLADLYDEVEQLGEAINSLQARLDELGTQREDVGVQLATARDAGDVDTVTELRIRLGAVDEVVAALTGQRQAAERRVVAIGGPDADGELAQTHRLLDGLQANQRRVLNELDPTRPEAQQDALLAELQLCVEAQAEMAREQLEQQNAPHQTTTILGK